ncbi:ABC transporter substrate-binding protein [Candidatus Sumerlaeota bacterium]|nr:ABC transporter substrate-binding protein [Candidatus Sumerlaeota bacterium]
MKKSLIVLLVLSLWSFPALAADEGEPLVLRFGHFPNVTHAQGVIAHGLSRQGKGWFEERLGPGVKIEWFVFNAGPSAMECFFAKTLDVTYVGPNPSINAHLRSKGEEVRVIAGATNGGAALVVRKDSGIEKAEDFRGKKIATPQFGNTQDVSCRAWLKKQGFNVTQVGGDVFVAPTSNPDQLALFQRGDIDGVWTVEPWVSTLLLKADGRVFLDEPDSMTTVLAARVAFLQEHADLAKKIAQAHAELTEWIRQNPAEAQKLIVEELTAETRREFPLDLVEASWPRLHFTSEITRESFESFLAAAQSVGFLKGAGDLSQLVDVPK